jgi:hypothetical protein
VFYTELSFCFNIITCRILKKKTNRKKKPRETIKGTSSCVRLEQVNKWSNCMLDR